MDLIFEVQRGKSFTIEVGYFDTVTEIKEKVQKYQGIPVSKQTLIFNGQTLQEDSDIEKCQLLHNSRLQLLLAPDNFAVMTEESSPPTPTPTPSSSTKIQLTVKIPSSSSKMHVPVEMDVNDTVLRLKEKIHDMEAVPFNKMLLHATATGTELHDHQLLRDCEVSDNSEIDVSIRLSPTASGGGGGGGGGGGSKKLKLMVLPKSGTNKIPVEMNATDSVGELRKELKKLHQTLQFHLPQEGYFFIYKQNVMDEDRSFRWHYVGQGDTIEIFNGSVTGGGS